MYIFVVSCVCIFVASCVFIFVASCVCIFVHVYLHNIIPETYKIPGKLKYLDAYRRVLATQESLDMWFIKVIFLGAPRLGKTTARRRLGGEIADISSSGEAAQPSTGVVESSVVSRNLSSNTALVTPSHWSISKRLPEEANIFLHFLYSHILQNKTAFTNEGNGGFPDSNAEANIASVNRGLPDFHADNASINNGNKDSHAITASSSKSFTQSSNPSKVMSEKSKIISELAEFFRKAVSPEDWKNIKHLFKDTALLKMEDTGGQPELMDMLAALTIGPALYLLFCKLIDNLHSNYTLSYISPSGESTTPVQSTFTMEETLLTALASVSCFSSYSTTSHVTGYEERSSTHEDELLASCNDSVAYILGTHKDLVSEQEITEFDEKLQHSIRSTDFFRKDFNCQVFIRG